MSKEKVNRIKKKKEHTILSGYGREPGSVLISSFTKHRE
jgi:hypothetical protein